MTGALTYILTFDALPELDRQGRPKMFYGQRLHDKCYRRAFFDSGQFVEAWDDEGARKGWCLYKMGCRGPTTFNSCSTFKWNCGQGWPVNSGNPCIGCAEDNFWDNGPFYQRLSNVVVPGIDSTPDQIGKTLTVIAGVGGGAHLITMAARKQASKLKTPEDGPGQAGEKE